MRSNWARKNTLADGAVTLNADVFFYKYQNYQISQIVDRTAVNLNVNATVRGAEVETSWEPLPGLKLGFNGGYENATINKNQYAIDLMDRTAGHPGWMVVRPFVTDTSNCVLPTYVVNELLTFGTGNAAGSVTTACLTAYSIGLDPATADVYAPDPDLSYWPNYPGFDPFAGTPGDPNTGQNVYNGVQYLAPNNGDGFTKNIGGNQLPNAPHFTTSLSADYTMPVSEDWAATLHGDFYWQSQSWWRIFNDKQLRQAARLFERQPRANPHQCRWLAGHGLCEERLRHDGHHRRVPELGRHEPHHQRLHHRSAALRGAHHQEFLRHNSLATWAAGEAPPPFLFLLHLDLPPPALREGANLLSVSVANVKNIRGRGLMQVPLPRVASAFAGFIASADKSSAPPLKCPFSVPTSFLKFCEDEA